MLYSKYKTAREGPGSASDKIGPCGAWEAKTRLKTLLEHMVRPKPNLVKFGPTGLDT